MDAADRTAVGRFELLGLLGTGSQGSVYLARDPSLARRVAIKFVGKDDDRRAPTLGGGALEEGRLACRLRHPNIVPVFEAGQCDGIDYLVFEFVKGKTLTQLLDERGAYRIGDAVELIGPLLDAIGHAHDTGVLHLDLSPNNVLVDEHGNPRIMDFGLAQHVSSSRRDRTVATGTLRYMAPEHFIGADFCPATDVFSLSMLFYRLVTGKALIDSDSADAAIRRIVNGEACLDGLLQFAHGAAFRQFVAGGLARDPAERYADGGAMKAAFDEFCRDSGLGAADATHATVDYLLRRMRRKGDFPALSRSMADLNRLRDDEATTSADRVASIILRDYALTNKLLKLVNSPYYRNMGGEISNISQAVVALGMRQVRMTANSLAFFASLQAGNCGAGLRNLMTRSLLAGLLTRHLARRMVPEHAEDAFICGVFRNLGECLVAHCLAEEYREINALAAARTDDVDHIAREVLGVGYGALGARVARSWNLPEHVVDIAGAPPPCHRPAVPASRHQVLRDVALLCNEFCDIVGQRRPDTQWDMLERLAARYEPAVALSEAALIRLLAAGLAKLQAFAPILDLDLGRGSFAAAAQRWVDFTAPGPPDAPAARRSG